MSIMCVFLSKNNKNKFKLAFLPIDTGLCEHTEKNLVISKRNGYNVIYSCKFLFLPSPGIEPSQLRNALFPSKNIVSFLLVIVNESRGHVNIGALVITSANVSWH